MRIAVPTTDFRCSVAVKLLVVVVAFWFCNSNRLLASCGDYLMPLGASSHGHDMNSPAADGWLGMIVDLHNPSPPAAVPSRSDCNGPSCGGGPKSSDVMNVVSVSMRKPVTPAVLLHTAVPQTSVQLAYPVVFDQAMPVRRATSIFRPPRILG